MVQTVQWSWPTCFLQKLGSVFTRGVWFTRLDYHQFLIISLCVCARERGGGEWAKEVRTYVHVHHQFSSNTSNPIPSRYRKASTTILLFYDFHTILWHLGETSPWSLIQITAQPNHPPSLLLYPNEPITHNHNHTSKVRTKNKKKKIQNYGLLYM